jgi:hypothetical protein
MIFQPEMLDTNKLVPEKMGRHKKTGLACDASRSLLEAGRLLGTTRGDILSNAEGRL